MKLCPSPVRAAQIVLLVSALVSTLISSPLVAELSERWTPMNQPVEAFRIIGNVYYVGASSVTAFLITTAEGHVLIDGGFEETVPLIRAGVERLGFRYEDIQLLLNSHAHFDHAGGLASIQSATGARFVASTREAPALERGGLGDDLLGDDAPFSPIRVDQRLTDGGAVSFGGVTMTARVTAGHTRGCTSWDFEVEDRGRLYRVVSICSLSVLDGMVFEVTPTYPTIAEDFQASFAALEAIPVDVFLASHAGFFQMKEKRQRQLNDPDGENPFVDAAGYRAYIAKARERFERALSRERASRVEIPPPTSPDR